MLSCCGFEYRDWLKRTNASVQHIYIRKFIDIFLRLLFKVPIFKFRQDAPRPKRLRMSVSISANHLNFSKEAGNVHTQKRASLASRFGLCFWLFLVSAGGTLLPQNLSAAPAYVQGNYA